MDLGLDGKIAVVTGSSRGIGRGIADQLTREGASVVYCARTEADVRAAQEASPGPGPSVAVAADVSTPGGAAALVAAAVDAFGGLDIVVNNVGGSGARTIQDMDVGDVEAVLDKNLISAVRVSRAALEPMRARGGGVICVIASIFGREQGGSPSYNLSKAAGISLANSMGRDLAKEGIRAFSVSPGSTRFPGGSWDKRMIDDPEGTMARISADVPWGRFGTVEEIADVVTFLCSPRASWVVGTSVVVDGGQSRAF
ncbi:MAG: SDR family oxidoreductase [Actinobacteria bacterium]|nr:SDR family oxidoreductase [Actinomycetota bacterium]